MIILGEFLKAKACGAMPSYSKAYLPAPRHAALCWQLLKSQNTLAAESANFRERGVGDLVRVRPDKQNNCFSIAGAHGVVLRYATTCTFC